MVVYLWQYSLVYKIAKKMASQYIFSVKHRLNLSIYLFVNYRLTICEHYYLKYLYLYKLQLKQTT